MTNPDTKSIFLAMGMGGQNPCQNASVNSAKSIPGRRSDLAPV